MLLTVYKNKRYKTINVPLSMKAEIEQMLKERGLKWYTMGWSEGEKENVELLEKCN
jgi:hypothetical protein